MTEEFPEQYREGLRLFNDEEFFECHEVLEELWSETVGADRKFLQGLIQAAVALFHFGNENFGPVSAGFPSMFSGTPRQYRGLSDDCGYSR